MKPEQKKLILALVLLAAAGAILLKFWPAGGPLPNKVRFVCVATGERFSISRDDIPSTGFPMKNPKTGAMTLVPLMPDDGEGRLFVNPRHAGCLHDPELAKVNKYVDVQTLEVLTSPRQ